jgi:uncharacterized protein YqeY
MRKLRLFLLKLTNPTAREIANEMMISILATEDHKRQIEAFNMFEDDYTRYLANERKEYLNQAKIINSFIPNESTVSQINVVYDQPIKN